MLDKEAKVKKPISYFKETVIHQVKSKHFMNYFLNSCVLCHSFMSISFVNVYLHKVRNASINKQQVCLNFPIKSFSNHLRK